MKHSSTIVAQATPPGRGGVGIVRISGSKVTSIAQTILGQLPAPRFAYYGPFLGKDSIVLDKGIALYFPAPHSYTGEDILELQGHGGQVIITQMIEHVITLGAKLAEPGEFSKRAFLNGKMDLIQVEAVADLIDATSKQAARLALASMQGHFSRHIHTLVTALTELRMLIEATLDFPDEDIDVLTQENIHTQINQIEKELETLLLGARRGHVFKEGLRIALAGRPNAGKSSLLNQLVEYEAAIVTHEPGTTRDVLREQFHIQGIPIHIVDTAGLRLSDNSIEKEGMRRAQLEFTQADRVVLVVDANQNAATSLEQLWPKDMGEAPSHERIIVVRNKIDLIPEAPSVNYAAGYPVIALSAKTGQGLEDLQTHLLACCDHQTVEGSYMARARHLDALERAHQYIQAGQSQLMSYKMLDMLAEDLRCAQMALGEITGEVSADDLLGEIFSSFCIGK